MTYLLQTHAVVGMSRRWAAVAVQRIDVAVVVVMGDAAAVAGMSQQRRHAEADAKTGRSRVGRVVTTFGLVLELGAVARAVGAAVAVDDLAHQIGHLRQSCLVGNPSLRSRAL